MAAALACGPANATASRYSTVPFELDSAGDFTIRCTLSSGGVNPAVPPNPCENPVLLIRSANPTTGSPGAWFAVGIPEGTDD